jgi:hypothetical protein
MDVSSILVYLRTSDGHKLALAPIGPQEVVWCRLKNKNDVEEIVRVWRSGDLRRRARLPGLLRGKSKSMVPINRHLVGVFDGKRRISVLEATPNSSRLHAAIPKAKTRWRSYGTIVEIKKFPLFLPSEKLPETKGPIQVERPTIAATPLKWEVLPPGWWRKPLEVIRLRTSTQRLRYDEVERLKFIDSLQPYEWYVGKDCLGHRSYYVAVFPTCVVAESATYGNAAYIVFDTRNWRTILSQTKRQVLKLGDTVVSRIPHALHWRSKVTRLIRSAYE